jgi:hypothetical protein
MELNEGQKLLAVVGMTSPNGEVLVFTTHGLFGEKCESIAVSIQAGQMAMVPWALCKTTTGHTYLVNLALVESVEIDTGDEE